MRAKVLSIICLLLITLGIKAQTAEFETASEAVKNMKVGWNLWNTLEWGGDPKDIDWFNPKGWQDWEIVAGNSITKPELMKMIRKAGFNAVRIPTNWYLHMDENNEIEPVWMNRIHEVVDYVIDQGMYCILNTHSETNILKAEKANYEENKDWFENLWRKIAKEFKDYDQRLLFEGYNEVTDKTGAFCFPNNELGEEHAKEAYQAINDYAQSFVDAVRSTGGNNLMRNLVVNTYSACVGPVEEEWCRRPYQEMKIPNDVTTNHIIFGIHCYWMENEDEVRGVINNVNECFTSRGVPTIVSEWGAYNEGYNYEGYHGSFIQQAKANGIATLLWGGLSGGEFRSYPAFEKPDEAKAVLKAYYGDLYEPQLLTKDDYDFDSVCKLTFTSLWAQFRLCSRELSVNDYKGIRLEMENPNNIHLLINGDGEGKLQRELISSSSISFDFDKSILGSAVSNIELQNMIDGRNETTIYHVYLIKNDGTEEELDNEEFYEIWGCLCEKKIKRKQSIHTVEYDYQWAELNIFYDDVPLKLKNYKGIRLEQAEATENAHIKVYGDGEQKEDYLPLTGTSTTIMFNPEIFSKEINRVTLQSGFDCKYQAKVISAWLIRQDGTEEYSDLSPFHGCAITNTEPYTTAIKDITVNKPHATCTGSRIYNLAGQRLSKPQKGINIINGRKVVVR